MQNKVGTVTGYVRMASMSLFLWDWILTSGDEVTVIWRSRWTRTKVLYLLLRYCTAATFTFDTYMSIESGLPLSVCNIDPIVSGLGIVLIIVIVQIILQLRIYAMYNRSRRLLYLNAVLFLAEIGAAMALMFELLVQGTAIDAPDWVIGSCYGSHPSTIWMIWLPPLIYESYLAALAVLKIVNEPAPVLPGKRSLMTVLVRDSVIYFIFVVSLVAVNAIMFAFRPSMPGVAISGLVDAASSIGGTRMIISIRKAAWMTPELPTLEAPVPLDINERERRNDEDEEEPDIEQQIDRPIRPARANEQELRPMV